MRVCGGYSIPMQLRVKTTAGHLVLGLHHNGAWTTLLYDTTMFDIIKVSSLNNTATTIPDGQ